MFMLRRAVWWAFNRVRDRVSLDCCLFRGSFWKVRCADSYQYVPTMKRLSLILPLLLALLCPLFLSANKDKAKKIVFIAGSRSHSSGEHEFRAGCMLLAKALNEQSGLNIEAVVVGRDWKKGTWTPRLSWNT